MKPYRVLIKSSTCSPNIVECWVLTAMLSVNDKGQRSIYITQRLSEMAGQLVLKDARDAMAKKLAHTVCTKKNSVILATYKIRNFETEDQEPMYKMYIVDKRYNVLSEIDAPPEYTQEDCLKACMEHFCRARGLEIETTL